MIRYFFIAVFCSTLVLLSVEVTYLEACGGYKLNVDFIRNCGKNDTVLLSNDFRPVLHDDCTITATGCTIVKRGFKTSEISFDIIRNGARYIGTKNACQLMEYANYELQSMMDAMGVPKSCPVKEGKICGHGKQISIRRHRLKLTMVAGNTRGKAELKTDVGNACFEFSASLNRKFFGR